MCGVVGGRGYSYNNYNTITHTNVLVGSRFVVNTSSHGDCRYIQKNHTTVKFVQ